MQLSPEWLPLTDYSTKYKVSVSTLRRKIKAEDISFRFEDGKYLIFDCPPEAHTQHRPSLKSEVSGIGAIPAGASRSSYFGPTSSSADIELRLQKARAELQQQNHLSGARALAPDLNLKNESKEESVLGAANRLLNELKKAYTQILHEREEQIMQLKEEAADLKTLIRVLESENDRLRGLKQ